MHASHPASLLVAALVMLRHPCPRNTATARLLLSRAALSETLSPPEREACRNLADDLEAREADDHAQAASRRAPDTPRPRRITALTAQPASHWRAGPRRSEVR